MQKELDNLGNSTKGGKINMIKGSNGHMQNIYYY